MKGVHHWRPEYSCPCSANYCFASDRRQATQSRSLFIDLSCIESTDNSSPRSRWRYYYYDAQWMCGNKATLEVGQRGQSHFGPPRRALFALPFETALVQQPSLLLALWGGFKCTPFVLFQCCRSARSCGFMIQLHEWGSSCRSLAWLAWRRSLPIRALLTWYGYDPVSSVIWSSAWCPAEDLARTQ